MGYVLIRSVDTYLLPQVRKFGGFAVSHLVGLLTTIYGRLVMASYLHIYHLAGTL